jgi:hypothetical protein
MDLLTWFFFKKYCKNLGQTFAVSKQSPTFAPRLKQEATQRTGALVQLVRIHACHAWGHGFESRTHRKKSERLLYDFSLLFFICRTTRWTRAKLFLPFLLSSPHHPQYSNPIDFQVILQSHKPILTQNNRLFYACR